jgi:hypothetical protein
MAVVFLGLLASSIGNGNGTFAAGVDYPAGAHPTSVAAADLNGDGRLDLVTTDYTTDRRTVMLSSCLPWDLTPDGDRSGELVRQG